MSAIKDKLAKGMQKSKDAVTGTPAIKIKIREATSNKSWGPTGQQLQELARCSFHYSSFGIIMEKIWKRLNDHGKNWRHIYKALLVLDYLIKNGSKQVIVDARQHLPNIQTLTTYQHIDSSDNDVGQSVRERSRAIIELLNDPERLVEEREKAKHNRGKYTDSMGSEAGRRATRSRDEGFSGDDFESKGDDYRGGRNTSPSYAKRGGVNSPRPGRKDSDEDDDIPRPEPLPQEWLSESQENMSITYNNDREAKPHKSPVPRSKPRKAQTTPGQTPPDVRDKAEQLKEMFVGLSTEDAIKILRKCDYSISDAALRLSDPHRMNKYTGQQQQQQQQPKEQRRPRVPTLDSTNTAPGHADPTMGMQNLSISNQGSGSFAPAFYGGMGVSQGQQPLAQQQFAYGQPQAQQPSFAAQPAAVGSSFAVAARQPQSQPQQPQGSFFATQPQAQQPPLSGSFSPAALGSGSSVTQPQNWTAFGATPSAYGSSPAPPGSAGSSVAAAPPQQNPHAAYFAQQQQQLQQQQLQLQQQQQQLQQQIQQQQQQQLQQQLLQQQQKAMQQQPPLSSGSAFPALQYAQQGTTPAVFATPQPYGSSSAPLGAVPGSPLQYPQSPQMQQQQQQFQQQLYQQSLASQSPQSAQTWSGQHAPLSGGFTPFGQVAAPQSPGLYGSSSFPSAQSQPQQQQQQQQQTNTDAFASLVAQQLPKGAQLQSLSPPVPQQQPEAKKTLAQMQTYPSYFPSAGQQLPSATTQAGSQNPFGQQSFF